MLILGQPVYAATLMFGMLIAWPALADDFVWRVAGPGNDVYLVGSVHLLPPQAYPLPDAYTRAYADSERLMFETDIGQLQNPATQTRLLGAAILPDGTTLRDRVSADLYARLQENLPETGLPLATVQRLRPWFVATMIELSAFLRAGYRPDLGVDTHFHDRALADGKPVAGLEPLETHLQVLTGMSQAQSEAYLAATLDNLERLDSAPEDLFTLWREGDYQGLGDYVSKQRRDHPSLFERMLDDRNRAWLPAIERLIASGDDAMVVVGALHLIGEGGLVSELCARGYEVDRN